MAVSPHLLQFTAQELALIDEAEHVVDTFLKTHFKPGTPWGPSLSRWTWTGEEFDVNTLSAQVGGRDSPLRHELLRRYMEAGWAVCECSNNIVGFKPDWDNK